MSGNNRESTKKTAVRVVCLLVAVAMVLTVVASILIR